MLVCLQYENFKTSIVSDLKRLLRYIEFNKNIDGFRPALYAENRHGFICTAHGRAKWTPAATRVANFGCRVSCGDNCYGRVRTHVMYIQGGHGIGWRKNCPVYRAKCHCCAVQTWSSFITDQWFSTFFFFYFAHPLYRWVIPSVVRLVRFKLEKKK